MVGLISFRGPSRAILPAKTARCCLRKAGISAYGLKSSRTKRVCRSGRKRTCSRWGSICSHRPPSTRQPASCMRWGCLRRRLITGLVWVGKPLGEKQILAVYCRSRPRGLRASSGSWCRMPAYPASSCRTVCAAPRSAAGTCRLPCWRPSARPL